MAAAFGKDAASVCCAKHETEKSVCQTAFMHQHQNRTEENFGKRFFAGQKKLIKNGFQIVRRWEILRRKEIKSCFWTFHFRHFNFDS
jgi:hypothetical protein